MLSTKLNQNLPQGKRTFSRIVSFVRVLINVESAPPLANNVKLFAKCCPKAEKVQQIECESSTGSLVSSDDDFNVGVITVYQAENNESDYDDLHSLIDSDDESDDENDDFDDQPHVDFVDSTTGISRSVQEDNNTSSVESESRSDGTDTDI